MNKLFNKLLLPALLIGLIGFVVACNPSQVKDSIVTSPPNPALTLYKRAWEIVKDEYYDEKLNGVDWNYWKNRYDGQIETFQDAHVAIETMIESLDDRYTRLLNPDAFKEQDISIESKISGIGIQIAEKDNKAFIISVLEDTPASKSGLKEDDTIISVNDTEVKGLDLKDIANLIRGKIGTNVKITINRDGKKEIFIVERDTIRIKSVNQKFLENGISYIRLNSFISQDADYEMEEAILRSNDSEAIILDLRGNYGGLLPNAISISNIFLERGDTIVSVINKAGNKRNLIALAPRMTDKPLIVLINGSSASASEIVSGALKDNKRATLVGQKTFGKGLVQKIVQLPDGSGINITVSKYLTPTGKDIDKIGIKPDLEVDFTLEDLKKGEDPQLEAAKKEALKSIKHYKAHITEKKALL